MRYRAEKVVKTTDVSDELKDAEIFYGHTLFFQGLDEEGACKPYYYLFPGVMYYIMPAHCFR